MPIQKCSEDGRPGWKWGESGKCYTYDPDSAGGSAVAKAKAIKQAVAIQTHGNKNNTNEGQVQI